MWYDRLCLSFCLKEKPWSSVNISAICSISLTNSTCPFRPLSHFFQQCLLWLKIPPSAVWNSELIIYLSKERYEISSLLSWRSAQLFSECFRITNYVTSFLLSQQHLLWAWLDGCCLDKNRCSSRNDAETRFFIVPWNAYSVLWKVYRVPLNGSTRFPAVVTSVFIYSTCPSEHFCNVRLSLWLSQSSSFPPALLPSLQRRQRL